MSGSKRAALHALFGTVQHQKDMQYQREFRHRVFFPSTPIERELLPLPFPKSIDLGRSFKIIKNGKGEGVPVRLDEDGCGEEIHAFRKDLAKTFSYYFRKGKMKKDGTFYQKKTKTNGVIETSISFPIGWSTVLKKQVKEGIISAPKLGEIMTEMGMKLIKKLNERSGYIPLYFNFHPESVSNPHFHFGLGTLDPETHLLVGRSATKKEGKKGLRLLGHAFLNTWRNADKAFLTTEKHDRLDADFLATPAKAFGRYEQAFDGTEKTPNSGFDDVALSLYMDELFASFFPELVPEAKVAGEVHATQWANQKLDYQHGYSKAQLNEKIIILGEQIAARRAEIAAYHAQSADPNSPINLAMQKLLLSTDLLAKFKSSPLDFESQQQDFVVEKIAEYFQAHPEVPPLVAAKLEVPKSHLPTDLHPVPKAPDVS
jgi:hypothetical protein